MSKLSMIITVCFTFSKRKIKQIKKIIVFRISICCWWFYWTTGKCSHFLFKTDSIILKVHSPKFFDAFIYTLAKSLREQLKWNIILSTFATRLLWLVSKIVQIVLVAKLVKRFLIEEALGRSNETVFKDKQVQNIRENLYRFHEQY